MFSSEQALIDYVRSADYDRGSDFPSPNEAERSNAADSSIGVPGYGGMSGGQLSQEVGLRKHPQKVGMAIIFNKAPLEGEVPKWDYTLRLNYTYGVSQLQDQVRGGVVLPWLPWTLVCGVVSYHGMAPVNMCLP